MLGPPRTGRERLLSNPRVLHVIPSVAPRYGGPSTAVWPMTSALREAGVDVELATTDRDGAGRLSADDLPDGRVPTHLFPSPSALSAWLRDHVSQYDLLHVHSLWNRVSAAACRAGRRAGIPYVIRPCGMLSAYTWARSPQKACLLATYRAAERPRGSGDPRNQRGREDRRPGLWRYGSCRGSHARRRTGRV